MKITQWGALAMGVAAALLLTPAREAKADGGVILGAGLYLGADYIVGRECRMRRWPLNIASNVAGAIEGRRVCRSHYYHRHKRRHSRRRSQRY